jgi:WD40 repeat protein
VSAQQIEVPFVHGMDQSGDPSAYSETGKFDLVHNLHVSPGHRDVLSVRPGVEPHQPAAGTTMTSARAGSITGRGLIVSDASIWMQGDSGALHQVSSAHQAATLSVRRIEVPADSQVTCQAVASDGSTVMTAVASSGASTARVSVQLTEDGVLQDSRDLITGSIPGLWRLWLLNTSAGYELFIHTTVGLDRYVYTAGVWSVATDVLAGASVQQLDVVWNSADNRVHVLHVPSSGFLTLARVSPGGATVSTSLITLSLIHI